LEFKKKKIQLVAPCKKHTSLAKTHTQTENERIENNIPSKWNPKAIFISDNIDFKPKLEGSRRSLHTNKGSNPSRR
jgi:hypothetical protein